MLHRQLWFYVLNSSFTTSDNWITLMLRPTKVSFIAYSHHLLISGYDKLIALSAEQIFPPHAQQKQTLHIIISLYSTATRCLSVMVNLTFSCGWLSHCGHQGHSRGSVFLIAVSYEWPSYCVAQQFAAACHAFWDSLIASMNSATIAHNSLMLTQTPN